MIQIAQLHVFFLIVGLLLIFSFFVLIAIESISEAIRLQKINFEVEPEKTIVDQKTEVKVEKQTKPRWDEDETIIAYLIAKVFSRNQNMIKTLSQASGRSVESVTRKVTRFANSYEVAETAKTAISSLGDRSMNEIITIYSQRMKKICSNNA
ncbi:hypothetical protein Phi19:2_gp080 [Cellulophaga phage phi19:2]|uniref:Uncharacterized protein n=2 Tax=Cellulophaga phage phiST TaxID=756282 RepID=M4SL75_9CAUD|nr:hypothetical protein CGPG_00029 [Cellulophaga phage phiST]AGH56728.1 hypothetical protein CGPG_00029 [Cellulophaga phage phiST]AGO47219.1 hypothetical protein PhiST_gp080 [Cellulophaga phage phiST]AGO48715.1 hypothetical protein Phi19:2_gp080 [Cellulophaga phage phi19:2]